MSGRRPHVELADRETALRAAGHTGLAAFERVAAEVLAATPDPVERATQLGAWFQRLVGARVRADLGQVFTPRPLAEWLWSGLGDVAGYEVVDPTAGSGLLLAVGAAAGAVGRGVEIDPALAAMASQAVGVRVRVGDVFALDPEPADLLVANPPFGVMRRDPGGWSRWAKGPAPSEVLFVELAAAWTRPGGRAAVVWPWGLARGRRFAGARRSLEAHFRVDAVAALPEGVFRPFGGAGGRALITWLTRRPVQDRATVRWTEVRDPGWDPRRARFVATGSSEIADRIAGRGWREVEVWPPTPAMAGPRLGDLAVARGGAPPGGAATLDLADVDAWGGVAPGRAGGSRRGRRRVEAGDLVVSTLRPERGLAAVVPDGPVRAGSGEWLVLRGDPATTHLLAATLRTPTFAAGLPASTGTTRPRVTASAMLDAPVRWPPPDLAATVSRALERAQAERYRAEGVLRTLAEAVARYGQNGDADALAEVVAGIEEGRCPELLRNG